MYSFAEGLREELREYGVTVTAPLPGATATEFHYRAGMGATKFGSNDWKNDPAVVARKGIDALFAGKDHVVGGDLKTRWAAIRQKFLPEQGQDRQFTRASRPHHRLHLDSESMTGHQRWLRSERRSWRTTVLAR